MEIELENKYLNATSTKQGDIVEIAGEGEKTQIKGTDGKLKNVYNFPVLCNGKELIYTPSSRSIKELIAHWTSDSKKWIGKKFQIKMVEMDIRGVIRQVIRPVIIDQKA